MTEFKYNNNEFDNSDAGQDYTYTNVIQLEEGETGTIESVEISSQPEWIDSIDITDNGDNTWSVEITLPANMVENNNREGVIVAFVSVDGSYENIMWDFTQYGVLFRNHPNFLTLGGNGSTIDGEKIIFPDSIGGMIISYGYGLINTPSWISDYGTPQTPNIRHIQYEENPSEYAPRTATVMGRVQFRKSGLGSYGWNYFTFDITQNARWDGVKIVPVSTKLLSYVQEDSAYISVSYTDITTDETITHYLGKYTKTPLDEHLHIDLMDIIKNYVIDVPQVGLSLTYNKFTVGLYTDKDYTSLITSKTVNVVNDYREIEYDADVIYLGREIPNKILKDIPYNMTFINKSDTAKTITITYKDSSTDTITLPSNFISNIEKAFTKEVVSITYITENGYRCQLIDCGKNFIVYRNSEGGFSTVALFGNYQMNRTYNRYTFIDKNIDRHTFKTDHTTQYTLNTGNINDGDADKIYDLFSSNFVLLNDTYEGVIDDNTVVHQNYEENGHKVNNYSFNFTLSHTNIQR